MVNKIEIVTKNYKFKVKLNNFKTSQKILPITQILIDREMRYIFLFL